MSNRDAPSAGRRRHPIRRLLWPALLLLTAAGCRQGGPPERAVPSSPVSKVSDYAIATAGHEIRLAPSAAGGMLYLAQPNSLVCALDATTGALRYNVDTAARLGAGRARDLVLSPRTGEAYLLAEPDQLIALQVEPLTPREALGLGTPDTLAALDPAALAVSPDGSLIAVVDQGNHRLTIAATSPLRLVGSLPIGKGPVDAVFAPDGRRLYVACEGTGEVVVVDVAGLKAIGRIPLGEECRPTGVAVAPDGARLYVATRDPGQVLEVDVAGGGVLRRAAAPGGRLRPTPDGRYLFAWDGAPGGISVIDAQEMRPVALPPLAGAVLGIALADDRLAHVALATSTHETRVSVLRLPHPEAPVR